MIEKRNFMGGMNFDDSDRSIPPNDYRFALNVSNSKNEDSGFSEVSNVNGARLIENEFLSTDPFSESKVIGSYTDKINNRIFYFIYQITTIDDEKFRNHLICYYDIVKDIIFYVLKDKFLNFDKAFPINHVNLIGDNLLWTDGINPPFKLNILKAMNGDYDPSQPNDDFLQVYSKPPMIAILAESMTDLTQKANNVIGKLWQFQYRYIYFDDTKSTFSPISKLAKPSSLYTGSTLTTIPYYTDNFFRLFFSSGDIEVDYVEISAREGNDGDFYSFVQIDVKGKDNTDETFDFYNDTQSLPILKEESGQLYSFVPLVASTQEVVQPNRICYGDFVEGYDNIDIDVSIDVEYERIDDTASKSTIATKGNSSGGLNIYTSGYADEDRNNCCNDPQAATAEWSYPLSKSFVNDWTASFQYGGSQGNYAKIFNRPELGRGTMQIPRLACQLSTLTYHVKNRDDGVDEDLSYTIGGKFTLCNHMNVCQDDDDCGGAAYGLGSYYIKDVDTEEPLLFNFVVGINIPKEYDNKQAAFTVHEKMQSQFLSLYGTLFTRTQNTTSPNGEDRFTTFVIKDQKIDLINENGKTATSNGSACGKSWFNTFRNYEVRFLTRFVNGGIDSNGQIVDSYYEIDVELNSPTNSGSYPNWYSGNKGIFDRETSENLLKNNGFPASFSFAPYIESVAVAVASDFSTKGNYKKGSRHQLALVYYDNCGRSTLAQTNEDFGFYIKSQNEEIPVSNAPDLTIPIGEADSIINLSIKHDPPLWATTWQILYSGNLNYQNFIYSNATDFDTVGELWSCVLTPLRKYQEDAGAVITYEFSEGDIIRFVYYAITDDSRPLRESTFDAACQSLIIKGEDWVDPDDDENIGYKVFFKPVSNFNTNPLKLEGNIPVLVELYTPKKALSSVGEESFSANIFYEIGLTYPVIDGTHLGYDPDGLPIQELNLDSGGDVYRRYRGDTSSGMIGFVEDMNFTDFKLNSSWDKGRPNVSDPSFKQVRRENGIIYSGVFTTNTHVNEINIFRESNFQEYETTYGAFKKFFYDDGSLLVITAIKVGRISINKDVLYDDGAIPVGTVGQADRVLGNIVFYVGDYGIGNYTESFTHFGSTRFFFDNNNALPIILYSNGLQPIDNKMNTYFQKKTDYLKYKPEYASQAWGMKSAWNNTTGELFVAYFNKPLYEDTDTFNIVEGRVRNDLMLTSKIISPISKDYIPETAQQTTVSFSEIKKRWSSFHGYYPEWIEDSTSNIVSFLDGNLYVHDNPLKNTFYSGEVEKSEIDVVFNLEADNTKVFKNFGVKGNDLWLSEKTTTPEGQETSNIESDYRDREGEYYAAILRDANSPKGLIEGESIRSYSITTKFTNKSQLLKKIWSASVEFFISHFTK